MKKIIYSFIILISSNLWCMETKGRRFTPPSIAARLTIIKIIQPNCSPETITFIQEHIGITHTETSSEPARHSWILLELLKLRSQADIQKNLTVTSELTPWVNKYHALTYTTDSHQA